MKKLWLVLLIVLVGCAGAATQQRMERLRQHQDGGQPSPLPTVITSPPVPEPNPAPYRFAVIGDFGEAGLAEVQIGKRMCNYRDSHPFDTIITTGDNIYPDGARSNFQSEFTIPFRCLLNKGVQFHAALGNHDIMTNNGAPELNDPRFGIEKHNYVYREGGVRFVIVDSNVLDKAWLRHALTARKSDVWTIAVFHHPVYSPGTGHGSTPGFRPSLPRMFKRKGVDLVLNGHDHIYSVSKPKRGIRYVVTGGGGGPLYGCSDHDFVDVCKAVHHFLFVKVLPHEITVKAIPSSGKAIDTFTVRQ